MADVDNVNVLGNLLSSVLHANIIVVLSSSRFYCCPLHIDCGRYYWCYQNYSVTLEYVPYIFNRLY